MSLRPDDRPGHAYAVDGGRLHWLGSDGPAATRRHDDLHHRFRDRLLGRTFPCLGGASAVRREHYRIGFYDDLAEAGAVRACAGDVMDLARDLPPVTHPVAVFVAVFAGPCTLADDEFETLLWRQLGGMLDTVPAAGRRPAPGEGLEPDDPGVFLDGREFFVVGMHPHASRKARRFDHPTLVFNALSHVRPLLPDGRFDTLRDRIRTRDLRLQGGLNPSLDASRLAQFSGRAVPEDWWCPYRPAAEGGPRDQP